MHTTEGPQSSEMGCVTPVWARASLGARKTKDRRIDCMMTTGLNKQSGSPSYTVKDRTSNFMALNLIDLSGPRLVLIDEDYASPNRGGAPKKGMVPGISAPTPMSPRLCIRENSVGVKKSQMWMRSRLGGGLDDPENNRKPRLRGCVARDRASRFAQVSEAIHPS